MLKNEGQWESLSETERLFLLAMAYQLPMVRGLDIIHWDILNITGFTREKMFEVAYQLEQKDLIRVQRAPLSFLFMGDAVTSELCGSKIPEFLNFEVSVSKSPRRYLIPPSLHMISSTNSPS